MNGEEDDIEIPRFTPQLTLPDDIGTANRMVLNELDVRRQVDEWLHRREGGTRRNARHGLTLGLENSKAIDGFKRMYYMATGALIFVQALLALALVYFKIVGK